MFGEVEKRALFVYSIQNTGLEIRKSLVSWRRHLGLNFRVESGADETRERSREQML